MVGVKRKSALTGSGEGPSKKSRKTGQGSRMTIKEQKLAMFKRPKPIVPLDHIPLEVLERLVNFLDVVIAIFLFIVSFLSFFLIFCKLLGVIECSFNNWPIRFPWPSLPPRTTFSSS